MKPTIFKIIIIFKNMPNKTMIYKLNLLNNLILIM